MQPKLSIGWRAVNHNLEDEGLPPLLDCFGVSMIEYPRVEVFNERLEYLLRSRGRERRVFGEIQIIISVPTARFPGSKASEADDIGVLLYNSIVGQERQAISFAIAFVSKIFLLG